MDNNQLLIVCIIVLFGALILWLLNSILEANSMFELGIILIIAGFLFGWPFVITGAILVIAHYQVKH